MANNSGRGNQTGSPTLLIRSSATGLVREVKRDLSIRGSARWIAEHWPVVAGLTALVSYAMVWGGATLFYSQLDLQPAEVGLGYGELLQKAVGLLALGGWVVGLFGLMAIGMGVLIVTPHLMGVWRATPGRRWSKLGPYIKLIRKESDQLRQAAAGVNLRAVVLGLQWIILRIILPIVIVTYLVLAFGDGSHVREGEPVTGLDAAILFPAHHANVYGISLDPTIDQGCLLYLGTDNETAVLWESKHHRVVRVPTRTGATVMVGGEEQKCK